jgi:ubiquinol-cytochrome c reductase cytochrome b subunit
LGIILVFQIVSGILLVFYYSNDRLLSFSRIQFIINETSVFTFIRILHFNGVRLFFIFLYLHIFKGLFFFSYKLEKVWLRGLTIYLLVMAEAFIGYAMV